jgi:uncharacterized repeat protein (TIGR02543 family)
LGEVWSGVEVKLKATQKTVERLFYVKPGADLSKIQVQLDGVKGLKLSKDGEIIIQTGLGDLKLSKPVAWQEKDGKKLPVEVSYKLIDKNRYSFAVSKADPSLPIVIDPILQSTYLGGNVDDEVKTLAIHSSTGDVYVAGYTYSTNFPKTTGGAQAAYGGGGYTDVFVTRLNSNLTQIIQSTYLGGSGDDRAYALAISSTGDVYVAGYTYSIDFPKTSGGAQANQGSYKDAFVSRLNLNLTQIIQSTYLGGSDKDMAYALAIHPSTGDVYVAGTTDSKDFPKTSGGAQPTYSGFFVSRLNSNLTQIIQSTYLGGSGDGGSYYDNDKTLVLAIHPNTGDVYVAGSTESNNFPKTTGGAQANYYGGYSDGFVSRLNSGLTQILQSTYLGGTNYDVLSALAIHPSTGDVYVAGTTDSKDFPKTTGGAQESFSGPSYYDAFVSRLSSNLTQIIQSTYLGGPGYDVANALAIHPSTGDVYVAGRTNAWGFPKTSGGAQDGFTEGSADAFVSRLNSNLTQIIQSTYLGGKNYDEVYALAIHPSTGDVYVAGQTASIDFPKTSGGAQENYGGGDYDAFVTRLSADLAATASSYTLSINPIPTNGKVTSSPAGINCGSGGSSCSASFTSGSTISLTAIPNTGYIFAGWTGDCSGCGTNTTCSINITTNKTCSANFTPNISDSGSGSGSGSGSSGGSGGGSGTGSDSGSNSGGGSGGSGGSSGGGSAGGGGGGCSMTGPASMAGWWNIFTWLLVPIYVLARRIRRMK